MMMKIEHAIGSIAAFDEQALDDLLRRARRSFDGLRKRVRRPEAAVGVATSPLGDLLIALTGGGVATIHYLAGAADAAATIDRLRLRLDLVEDRRAVECVGEEIRRYLAGERKALRQGVDLGLAATAFQQKVLRKLQEVPRGAVLSYQALGAAAGAPQGARAVGNAMRDNPVPIYVPCHRVIASDGGLGGYGGGARRKLQLLRSEGFDLGARDRRLPALSVWGHKQTKIYCRRACPTAARVDSRKILFFADSQAAQRAGLRPCRICRPE